MSEPAISVVVPAESFAMIRETARALAAQTIARRVELLVVAPRPLEIDCSLCAPLHGVRLVRHPVDSLPRARAAGIQAAAAPVVLLGETHSFPEPGSLAALVERHREPWAAVGQVICNANPRSLVSWANQYLDYGRWADGQPGGEVSALPDHNCSYKRELLAGYGDALADRLAFDARLHDELRACGYGLYLEPRARTRHVNVSRRSSWLRERHTAGRAFAAARAAPWPLRRRALYGVAAPLIPAVRFARAARDLRRTGRGSLLPRLAPVLAVGLVVSAAGEWLGYLAGDGQAKSRMYRIELDRLAHVRPGELSSGE